MRIIDIINGPWAITPEMLTEIRSIYAKHMRGEKIDKGLLEQLAAANGAKKQAAETGLEIVNGTAIIPVEGVIAKKMNIFMALCGGASTQLVERDIRKALADDSVKQVLLYVDSPGGTVDGTFELSNFIHANRQSSGGPKPINTFSDGAMYSAAYGIGSAADAAYISSNAAGVGSIGVVAAHEDWSKAEERMGIKTTEIYAGKYKRIASQTQPLSQEGRQSIQDEVDYLYSVFVDAVARNRGVSSEEVLNRMSTNVKSAFIGEQAVEAGLVDGIVTMEDMLSGKMSTARRAMIAVPFSAGAPERKTIAAEEGIVDLKELQEKHPDLYQSVLAEGKAVGIEEGKKAGAEAELARVKSVKAVAMPGHEALIESLLFDGKTTGPEAAMQVVQAESKKRAAHLADFKADGKDVQTTVVDGTAAEAAAKAAEAASKTKAEDKTLPVEERAKAAWDGDAAIRAEFGGSYAGFEAYYKANDAGLVKQISKGK